MRPETKEPVRNLVCDAQQVQHERVFEISSNLFGPNLDWWVCHQLWTNDERLFVQKAPIKSQQEVLSLITQIDPTDHKARRFLGESLHKTKDPCCPNSAPGRNQRASTTMCRPSKPGL